MFKPMVAKLIRTILVGFLSVGVLAACTVEMAYNNIDRLIVRWLDDQVDLTAEQRQWLRQSLIEPLEWHCQAHLPEYADLLERLMVDVESDSLTRTRLSYYSQNMERLGEELTIVSLPLATELLSSFSDEQVSQLLASFEENNQNLIERIGEQQSGQLSSQREKRMVKRLRRFMGRLTNEQSRAVSDWAANYEFIEPLELARAYVWQDELAEALSYRQSDPERFAQSIQALVQPEGHWHKIYRGRAEANRELTSTLIIQLMGSATTRQKRRINKTIGGYAEDFDALSCVSDQALALYGGP